MLARQIEYVESLREDVKQAILEYTDTEFRDLNERLRTGQILSRRHRQMVDLLDSAFDAVPPLALPLTVYRGIKAAKSFSLETSAYVSSSLDENVARSFQGKYCCRLAILLPAGSRVLPIESLSNAPSEKELLLPRDGSFLITNARREGDLQLYDLLYVPATSVELPPDLKRVPPMGEELERWVERILRLVDVQEMEMGLWDSMEELVRSVSACLGRRDRRTAPREFEPSQGVNFLSRLDEKADLNQPFRPPSGSGCAARSPVSGSSRIHSGGQIA